MNAYMPAKAQVLDRPKLSTLEMYINDKIDTVVDKTAHSFQTKKSKIKQKYQALKQEIAEFRDDVHTQRAKESTASFLNSLGIDATDRKYDTETVQQMVDYLKDHTGAVAHVAKNGWNAEMATSGAYDAIAPMTKRQKIGNAVKQTARNLIPGIGLMGYKNNASRREQTLSALVEMESQYAAKGDALTHSEAASILEKSTNYRSARKANAELALALGMAGSEDSTAFNIYKEGSFQGKYLSMDSGVEQAVFSTGMLATALLGGAGIAAYAATRATLSGSTTGSQVLVGELLDTKVGRALGLDKHKDLLSTQASSGALYAFTGAALFPVLMAAGGASKYFGNKQNKKFLATQKQYFDLKTNGASEEQLAELMQTMNTADKKGQALSAAASLLTLGMIGVTAQGGYQALENRMENVVINPAVAETVSNTIEKVVEVAPYALLAGAAGVAGVKIAQKVSNLNIDYKKMARYATVPLAIGSIALLAGCGKGGDAIDLNMSVNGDGEIISLTNDSYDNLKEVLTKNTGNNVVMTRTPDGEMYGGKMANAELANLRNYSTVVGDVSPFFPEPTVIPVDKDHYFVKVADQTYKVEMNDLQYDNLTSVVGDNTGKNPISYLNENGTITTGLVDDAELTTLMSGALRSRNAQDVAILDNVSHHYFASADDIKAAYKEGILGLDHGTKCKGDGRELLLHVKDNVVSYDATDDQLKPDYTMNKTEHHDAKLQTYLDAGNAQPTLDNLALVIKDNQSGELSVYDINETGQVEGDIPAEYLSGNKFNMDNIKSASVGFVGNNAEGENIWYSVAAVGVCKETGTTVVDQTVRPVVAGNDYNNIQVRVDYTDQDPVVLTTNSQLVQPGEVVHIPKIENLDNIKSITVYKGGDDGGRFDDYRFDVDLQSTLAGKSTIVAADETPNLYDAPNIESEVTFYPNQINENEDVMIRFRGADKDLLQTDPRFLDLDYLTLSFGDRTADPVIPGVPSENTPPDYIGPDGWIIDEGKNDTIDITDLFTDKNNDPIKANLEIVRSPELYGENDVNAVDYIYVHDNDTPNDLNDDYLFFEGPKLEGVQEPQFTDFKLTGNDGNDGEVSKYLRLQVNDVSDIVTTSDTLDTKKDSLAGSFISFEAGVPLRDYMSNNFGNESRMPNQIPLALGLETKVNIGDHFTLSGGVDYTTTGYKLNTGTNMSDREFDYFTDLALRNKFGGIEASVHGGAVGGNRTVLFDSPTSVSTDNDITRQGYVVGAGLDFGKFRLGAQHLTSEWDYTSKITSGAPLGNLGTVPPNVVQSDAGGITVSGPERATTFEFGIDAGKDSEFSVSFTDLKKPIFDFVQEPNLRIEEQRLGVGWEHNSGWKFGLGGTINSSTNSTFYGGDATIPLGKNWFLNGEVGRETLDTYDFNKVLDQEHERWKGQVTFEWRGDLFNLFKGKKD